MKRRHSMPFGTEVLDDGSVRFRLWAPAAQQVDLSITGTSKAELLPMERCDDWFEIEARSARAGMRYQFRIDGSHSVPDPASRFQPMDVHGPSEIIDPTLFDWQDGDWRGRPWVEAVIYELHAGTF